MKMCFGFQDLIYSLAILMMMLATPCSSTFGETAKNNIKSGVFLSPKIELGAGSVSNKFYYDLDFPKGHIAIKSFDAEVVDEFGNSVPLHETYLHHWVIGRYYNHKNVTQKDENSSQIVVRNSGLCQGNVLGQYFGLGSETRGTDTFIQDPFGIEIGNPKEIPKGYEEKWVANIHAIDTRGVEDKKGCTECRCNLYNVTKDENSEFLSPNYIGGLHCCNDLAQCKLREGFKGTKRSLYLRYTVKWVDWDSFVVPVKVYIFDVTDTLQISHDSKGVNNPIHHCQVEYQVEPCRTSNKNENGCINVKRTSLPFQNGGYVIYGVAHQHSGGIGSTLLGQDGRVICSSIARYGNGREAGNEEGYIVGMSSCNPKPGSIKISDGETLTLLSNYSSNNDKGHTGVMGLFYILVAQKLPH